MLIENTQAEIAIRLAIAGMIGLAAGLEREWSGHASGPDARFAGLRTFLLLGTLGGIAGSLGAAGQPLVAGAIALSASALCVVAYGMAVHRPTATTDGTTEAAALIVVALGVIAGIGWTGLAAGAGALVVLALSEKTRLHWLVRRLGEPELRAGLQFAVLAIVVLPLLPSGPYLGIIGVRPRALWAIVLLFSGLNFAGFVARRVAGAHRGYKIAGALGGAISSTAVTLSFSRQSRRDADLSDALAGGVIAACTVLVPRVVLVSAVLNPRVAVQLLMILAPAFIIGVAIIALGWRTKDEPTKGADEAPENPLHLAAAVRMAIAFQVGMTLIALVRQYWGLPGVFATAAALGLTDVDALTVSMSRQEALLDADIAARAIAVGILANTVMKLGIAVVLGRSAFRRRTSVGLVALAAGTVAGLVWL
ncbi:MAG TPA: MgtC/SapB family protein [Gemmatimonadaceae bacterium]